MAEQTNIVWREYSHSDRGVCWGVAVLLGLAVFGSFVFAQEVEGPADSSLHEQVLKPVEPDLNLAKTEEADQKQFDSILRTICFFLPDDWRTHRRKEPLRQERFPTAWKMFPYALPTYSFLTIMGPDHPEPLPPFGMVDSLGPSVRESSFGLVAFPNHWQAFHVDRGPSFWKQIPDTDPPFAQTVFDPNIQIEFNAPHEKPADIDFKLGQARPPVSNLAFDAKVCNLPTDWKAYRVQRVPKVWHSIPVDRSADSPPVIVTYDRLNSLIDLQGPRLFPSETTVERPCVSELEHVSQAPLCLPWRLNEKGGAYRNPNVPLWRRLIAQNESALRLPEVESHESRKDLNFSLSKLEEDVRDVNCALVDSPIDWILNGPPVPSTQLVKPDAPSATRSAAEVVDLSLRPAPLPSSVSKASRSSNEWFAAIKNAGLDRALFAGNVRLGDPEWPRIHPLEGGSIGEDLAAASPGPESGRGRDFPFNDTEHLKTWPGKGGDGSESLAQTGMLKPNLDRPQEDLPRFVWGEGLDAPPHEPKKAPPVKPSEPEARKAALNQKKEEEAKAKARSAQVKQKAALLKRLAEARKRLDKENASPEKRFQVLLQEVEAQKEQRGALLEGVSGLEKKDEASKPDKNLAGRPRKFSTPQGERALQALREKAGIGRLQGRIVVAGTKGKTVLPCRVRITDASDTAVGARIPQVGYWCEGRFSVPVIAGQVKVEVSAGRFWSRYLKAVEVKAGEAVELTIELTRPPSFDFRKKGWYLADLNYALGARRGKRPVWVGGHPTISDAALAAVAEGVDVLGLTEEWNRSQTVEAEQLVWALLARIQGPNLLLMPTFDGPQHAFCGTAMGIGARSMLDIPKDLSDPRQPLVEYFEEFRRRGGLAVFAELSGRHNVDPRKSIVPVAPYLIDSGFYRTSDDRARLYAPAELPFDTVVGPAYDVLAFDGSETALAIWFRLLNDGYAIPLIGAGGNGLEEGQAPRGQTFVKLEGRPTWEKVVGACRKGASSVSFGPAVFVRIVERDKGVGDRLEADGRKLTMEIQAFTSLDSNAKLHAIEIIRNGKVVWRDVAPELTVRTATFPYTFSENKNAWYVVRITEKVGKGTKVYDRAAITNPIYFDVPGRGSLGPARAQARLRGTMKNLSGTPLAGSVTVIEPEGGKRVLRIGGNGRYDVTFAAAGALVFSSPGYEPVAKRPFNEPEVLKALGTIHTAREAGLKQQLTKKSTYGLWRLLISDLKGDAILKPIDRTLPIQSR